MEFSKRLGMQQLMFSSTDEPIQVVSFDLQEEVLQYYAAIYEAEEGGTHSGAGSKTMSSWIMTFVLLL